MPTKTKSSDLGTGLGSGSGSGLSFEDLHNRFLAIVGRQLTASAAQITPRCELQFHKFIDSGVFYLLDSGAPASKVKLAEEQLRRFTMQLIGEAKSKGESTLDVRTFHEVVKIGGMWCPPFCGGEE